MASVSIGVLSVFNHEMQDWCSYKGRLEQWFLANGIDNDSDKSSAKRRAILLSSLAETTYRLACDLALPKEVGTLAYGEVVDLIDCHFKTKVCSFAERYKFHSAVQSSGESLAQWSARVRGLAKDCSFPSSVLEETLRDRFVLGMAAGPERDRLFTEPMEGLSLQRALQLADSVRCARQGARRQPAPGAGYEAPLDVHKMAASERAAPSSQAASSSGQGPPRFSSTTSANRAELCAVCGFQGHNKNKCRFKNAICRKCGIKGHLQRLCVTNKQRNVFSNQHFLQACSDDGGDDGKCLIFNLRSYQGEPMQESVIVNNVTLSFEIDTGSAVTAISEAVYNKYFSEYPLQVSTKLLQSYNGGSITTLGTITLPFYFQSRSELLNVYVVRNGGPPLLGRDFLSKFKLQISPINNVQSPNSIEEFSKSYPQLFSDKLGCCKDVSVKLKLKPDSTPIYRKARPVPFALRKKT